MSSLKTTHSTHTNFKTRLENRRASAPADRRVERRAVRHAIALAGLPR